MLVLYRRTPKSLPTIQTGLILTIGLRAIAGWVFPLLANLPSAAFRTSYPQRLAGSFILFGIGTAWYLYLARSERVREIYAA